MKLDVCVLTSCKCLNCFLYTGAFLDNVDHEDHVDNVDHEDHMDYVDHVFHADHV